MVVHRALRDPMNPRISGNIVDLGPPHQITTRMKISTIVFFFLPFILSAQPREDSAFVRNNYTKREVYIVMRDGAKLFTAIYEPKEASESLPILMQRTPYSCNPYGIAKFRRSLGPNPGLMREKYIFVYQDVRGRYKSEGNFKEMTPAIDDKKTKNDVDESSDTYDTIEWLLKNTKNNGRVGIYGISYPGFYASASLPNAHPAIKAVSPQAPVTDEFIGDDCNHNGAFFLLDNFGFYNYFDGQRTADSSSYTAVFKADYSDAYEFFKQLGPLKNSDSKKFFNHNGEIWNQIITHDTYDTFWRARNIRPHFNNIKPAVLVVGGWFDAEDMFGALRTYKAIEKQTPQNNNRLVMGPWTHGAWAVPTWTSFGTHSFGSNINEHYREIESAFFNFYLKDKGTFSAAEASVFETGSNRWKQYDTWPPVNASRTNFYFQKQGKLSSHAPKANGAYSEYTSDPVDPIPYTNGVFVGRNNEYVVEDQRFAAKRPDVLSFQSEMLDKDILVTGRISANLFVSTSGTDADFIVKLIDVLPEDEPNPSPNPRGLQMAGFQRLVRAEVFRGKFRKSYEIPQPFVPNQVDKVSFDLNEVAHLFKKGHRIMVQVQSSWFPIVDLNPQKFVKIPEAAESDFQKATIRVYHDEGHPSSVTLPILR